MANRRAARVAERIREDASRIILYELVDPRIELVTVTKVDISNDLHYATVYVSVLGDENKRRTVLRGLESARGLVQSRIAKGLGLREAPIISFEYDHSIEKAIELSKLIDQATADLPERQAEAEALANADADDVAEPGGEPEAEEPKANEVEAEEPEVEEPEAGENTEQP